jgi:transketolase N-terminal domain/subunit
MTIAELEKTARTLRLDIIKMIGVGQKGHLGGSCCSSAICISKETVKCTR